MARTLGLRAAALTLVVGAGLGVAAPASATPPVAQDDHKWMYPGEFRVIDVLANDSDPDGDELAICRLAPVPEDADYFVAIEGGKLVVFSGEGAEDIVVTYYACDYETLVPATLTVSFREVTDVVVEKAARPGRLRVTNANDRVATILYGSFREPRPDGRARVPANGSIVVMVHRHKIDWVAFLGRTIPAGYGHVREIELPGDRLRAPSAPRFTRADTRAWGARSN
ncbi:hypothetical protein F0U44_05455 [Nocardioides humilatus]|uniref:Uncharacterized protein n=1 Tax=Nocardioides humilatus TaxID=2607660 RepID=A0A5B1LPL8_9ACTN|nr:Ig-like domain-containing protein [Nocardioides humilatus]KAA1421720.1 hypothetical protein F0U44_05455 [Nocardioides humilatus]